MLDSLASYPIAAEDAGHDADDRARQPEIMACQIWFGEQLERQVSRELWRVYVDGCAALVET